MREDVRTPVQEGQCGQGNQAGNRMRHEDTVKDGSTNAEAEHVPRPWLWGYALVALAAVLIVATVSRGDNVERVETKPGDFRLTISADKDTYIQGELPVISVTLTNASGKGALLAQGYDSSSSNLERYPKIGYITPEGKPFPGGVTTLCGVGAPELRPSDFVQLDDGKSFDPRPPIQVFDSWDFREARTYKIRFVYDTRGSDEAWRGWNGGRGVLALLGRELKWARCRPTVAKVPVMYLVSNEITIAVEESDSVKMMRRGPIPVSDFGK